MSGENKRSDRYVAAYDAAQQLHARLAENTKAEARLAEMFSVQGEALHQVKNFARVGFMLSPDATEKGFEQLWRKAFHAEKAAKKKGGKR